MDLNDLMIFDAKTGQGHCRNALDKTAARDFASGPSLPGDDRQMRLAVKKSLDVLELKR